MDFIVNAIQALVAAPFICCGWIIVGAIAGALANRIVGGTDAPLINDIILGLVGAVVGGFVLNLFEVGRPQGGLTGVIASLVVATLGAVIILAVGRALRGRR